MKVAGTCRGGRFNIPKAFNTDAQDVDFVQYHTKHQVIAIGGSASTAEYDMVALYLH